MPPNRLISLASAGVCQYEKMFSPGTPHTVIIAAIKAALRPPWPKAASSSPSTPDGTERAGAAGGAGGKTILPANRNLAAFPLG